MSTLSIEVTEQVPTGVHLCAANHRYPAAKATHAAHTLDIPDAASRALQ